MRLDTFLPIAALAALLGSAAEGAAAEPQPDTAERAPETAGDAGETEQRDGARTHLLAEIEAALERIESMKADFIQTTPEGAVHHGTLSLERPGRLRFDYTDGTPLLLVSDGKLLTFVDYGIGQVTRWPIEDTPLGLLVQEEIRLAGDPRILDVEEEPESGRVSLTAHDPERAEEGVITLTFAREGDVLRLTGWRVVDGRGAVTRVRLRDVERNLALADSLWTFEDPRKLPSQRRRRAR